MKSFIYFVLIATFSTGAVQMAKASQAQFGLSPDNSQGLLLSAIERAHSSLAINIYQFEELSVLDAVVAKIRAGLSVQILIEGQPFGGVHEAGKNVIEVLKKEMKAVTRRTNHLFIMTLHPGDSTLMKRRFRYDHAKYVLIDGQKALISSENFTDNGHPTSGMTGNRGWEVFLDDSQLVSELQKMFTEDTQLSFGDVVDEAASTVEISTETFIDQPSSVEPLRARKNPAIPVGNGEVTSVRIITSPDSAPGLTDVLHSARQTLDIEEMNLPVNWHVKQSPLVTGILDAARAGARVRVLLNDEGAFNNEPAPEPETFGDLFTLLSDSGRPNQTSVDYLNQVASSEHLSLDARIINLKSVGLKIVHNKGMIADKARVLVSSINGTENSVMHNRELGVLLESPAAAAYFTQAFDYDWTLSAP